MTVSIALVLAFVALILLPKWQTRQIPELGERLRLENKYRATLAEVIGGCALLAGTYIAYSQIRVAVQTSEQSSRQIRHARIADTFSRAIDHIGARTPSGEPAIEQRLGGIFTLWRISEEAKELSDSPGYQLQIRDILAGYVRENAKRGLTCRDDASRVRSDVQTAVTLLGSHPQSPDYPPLDLSEVDLSGVGMPMTHFEGAIFDDSCLTKADMRAVNLRQASLKETTLRGAFLTNSNFHKANLTGAVLDQIEADSADLSEAVLTRASLVEAHLQNALLSGSIFIEADLSGANPEEARALDGATLLMAKGLSQEQLQLFAQHGAKID